MSNQTILEYFQNLGFEEIEIEDNLTALCVESSDDDSYGLVTDYEGGFPNSLTERLIFAYYDPMGAYQWSASFKNAAQFQAVWSSGADLPGKFAAVHAERDRNIKE